MGVRLEQASPVVSIITPCYNGAKTVHRMIESVLAQTYDTIEYIIVNDGSTDRSEDIILSYQKSFADRGYAFKYVHQENKGLGGAINAGLKEATGAYLCWADADDFYAPESVKMRVEWMEQHPDYGVVTSDAYIVNESNLYAADKRIAAGLSNNNDEHQFWHLLEANSIFCAGTHMIRMCCFDEVVKNRSIYPARRGQNWQMLLPMYYKYKRHFMNEPLYSYVVSDGSMSHDDSAQKKLLRCSEHEDILHHVLQDIPMTPEDATKAQCFVRHNFARKRLYIAFNEGMAELANEQYKALKAEKALTLRDKVYHFGANHQRIGAVLKKL